MRAYQKDTHWLEAEDGTRIAYHLHRSPPGAPARRPTVLLTNGIFTTENFWRDLVEHLTPEFRVAHWDFRGHGASEVSRSDDYSMRRQAADLQRVIEALRAENDGRPPFHVAFSMGVTVLFELHRAHPELLPAMVLVSGSPDGPGSHTFPLSARRVQERVDRLFHSLFPSIPRIAPPLYRVLRSPAPYLIGRLAGVLRRRAPQEDIEQLMQGIAAMNPESWWRTLQELLRARNSDVLPSVRAPTLIVGASHDRLMPRPQLEALRRGLPHARYLEVPDTGHAILVEAGPEVAREVRAFLKGLAPEPPRP